MRLLLIFVLTFTLSTQTDNTDRTDEESMDNTDKADAESTDNNNKDNDGTETQSDNPGMMEKVMTALGDDGLLHLMTNLNEDVLAKLMECGTKSCKMEDLSEEIPKVINCIKTYKGGELLCKLVKAFVTEGPMAMVLNTLGDDGVLHLMNNLNGATMSKMTKCMSQTCTMADFSDEIPNLINCMKTFKGGKVLCKLVKGFVSEGPMANVINALGDDGVLHLLTNLDEGTMTKMTKCMSQTCTLEDLSDEVPNLLKCMKAFKGGKPLCKLIKAFVPEGPMSMVVNALGDDGMLQLLNRLTPSDLKELMKMGNGPPNLLKLAPIGLKLLPILTKANGGKGIGDLISMFMGTAIKGGKPGGLGGGLGGLPGLPGIGISGGLGGGLGGLPGLPGIGKSGGLGGGLGGLPGLPGTGGGGKRSGRKPNRQRNMNYGDRQNMNYDVGQGMTNMNYGDGQGMNNMNYDVGQGMTNMNYDVGQGMPKTDYGDGQGMTNMNYDVGQGMPNKNYGDRQGMTNMNYDVGQGMPNMNYGDRQGMTVKYNRDRGGMRVRQGSGKNSRQGGSRGGMSISGGGSRRMYSGGRTPMMGMNGGGGSRMSGMNGGLGMQGRNGGGGGRMSGMNGGGGSRMPGMNGSSGGRLSGMNGGGGGRLSGMNGGGGGRMPGMNGAGGMQDMNGAGGMQDEENSRK